jgi:hypothetical protein
VSAWKLINLLAVKQPIVGVVPDDSETAKVVRNAQCGKIVSPITLRNCRILFWICIRMKERENTLEKMGGNFLMIT